MTKMKETTEDREEHVEAIQRIIISVYDYKRLWMTKPYAYVFFCL